MVVSQQKEGAMFVATSRRSDSTVMFIAARLDGTGRDGKVLTHGELRSCLGLVQGPVYRGT